MLGTKKPEKAREHAVDARYASSFPYHLMKG